jgi:hypothetical protein
LGILLVFSARSKQYPGLSPHAVHFGALQSTLKVVFKILKQDLYKDTNSRTAPQNETEKFRLKTCISDNLRAAGAAIDNMYLNWTGKKKSFREETAICVLIGG